MNYIYKITNKINQKIYIGKTRYTPSYRWSQHVYAALKAKDKEEYDYLLHRAIRKYGVENFLIEVIEEVQDESLLDDRENFWIDYYNSCVLEKDSNGYNMTYGGKGSPKINKKKIFNYWDDGLGSLEISHIMSISRQTCKKLLETYSNYDKDIDFARNNGVKVYQFNSNGDFLAEYPSIAYAARSINVDPSTISKCCNHVKNSCGGYFWSYSKEEKFTPQKLKTSKKYYIAKIDLNTNKIIDVFNSLKGAAASVDITQPKYIKQCCENQREQMYNYKWKYISKDEYDEYVDAMAVEGRENV